MVERNYSKTDAKFTGTIASSWELNESFTFDVTYEALYETERKKILGSPLGAVTYRR